MTQALVTTKLRAPRTRPILVARPRLRDALAAGEGRSLTLVSAPAGFGKTTLLGEWSEDRSEGGERSVAWLSLDETDNDLPDEEGHRRNFAAVCLGDALRTAGDLSAASEALAEATKIGRTAGHVYGTLNAMVLHARVQADRGRLREAEEAFQLAMRFVTEEGVGLLPSAGVVHVGMADLHYERNDLDGAEHEMKRGMELAEQAREVSNLVGRT